MTIRYEHPFLPPEEERSPIRRLRGRLAAPVTLWTAYDGDRPVGLPVSSILVAEGKPARLLGLVDPDSDLWSAAEQRGAFAVTVLRWRHRALPDAFAGLAPAPGGPFRLADWSPSRWGPVLAEPASWAGCRLEGAPRRLGWGLLVEAEIEHVDLDPDESEPLLHWRGRYRTV